VYNVYGEKINPNNQMPINPNQLPALGQKVKLPTDRVKSSILKGGTDSTWTYPSPQMFYNANLIRSGKNDVVSPESMEMEVKIHNNLNEHTWNEVMRWEKIHYTEGCPVTLLKFYGLASKYSPTARIRHWLGKELPFDRHDWIIDRCGKEFRYVIDYYYDETVGNDNRSRYLVHVRPALDSFSSLWDRIKARFGRMFNIGERIGGYTTPGFPKLSSDLKVERISDLEKISDEEFEFLSSLDYKKVLEIHEIRKKNCGKLENILSENKDNSNAIKALNCCTGKIVCPKFAEQFYEKLTNFKNEEDISESYAQLLACLRRYSNQEHKVIDFERKKLSQDL